MRRRINDPHLIFKMGYVILSGKREEIRIRGAEHIPPDSVRLPQQMMYFVHNYNHTKFDSVYQKAAADASPV